MRNLQTFLALVLAAAFTPMVHAEPLRLFSSIAYVNKPPPEDSLAVYDSTLDIQGLAGMPPEVAINIPRKDGELSVILQLEHMDRREGFTERDPAACSDGDSSACELIPVPKLPADQLSYTWTGQGEGYDLRLTIHRGSAVGVVAGPKGRFNIGWNTLKELRIEYFRTNDMLELGGVENDSLVPELTVAKPSLPMSASFVKAATIARFDPKSSNLRGTAVPELDMLVLVTDEARREAGGNAANCHDTAGVLAYIQQNISSMNTAFERSQVVGRIGAVTVARLGGFSVIPYNPLNPITIQQNRNNIQASANIQNFRNAVGADVVSTLVAKQSVLGVCGVAFIQRPDCGGGAPGCGSGSLFSNYTSLIETIECAVMDTFTHELGHVLGAEHDRANTTASNTSASFDHSFGYNHGTTASPGFETIMSQKFSSAVPVRLLQFSNPNVLYMGVPTGDNFLGLKANNALTLTNLMPGTAAFRNRPDTIFNDDFDGIPACVELTY